MLDSVEQVVIIDSSDDVEHKWLVHSTKQYPKIEIYYTLPLGHVEPLRLYGISKCKGEWILYLDTDERINERLKNDLKRLLEKSNISGYLINRITVENESKRIISEYTYKQLRLYKKNKITYYGYIHELPKVKGKISLLDNRYSIKQIHTSIQSEKEMYRYIPIEIYENRLNYALIVHRAKNPFTKFLAILLSVGKNPRNELSKFDYFIYAVWGLFYTITYSFLKAKTIERLTFQIFNYNLKKINYLFSLNNYQRKETFLIYQQIRRARGPIKYLGLNNPVIVNNLQYNYSNINRKNIIPTDDKGINYFIKLLEEKYYNSAREIK
ncbi:MAG: hypothetical protein M1326_07055 [Cyanobacteria bacterium]|nr:hypothetical protein [Cyanobacteriota bacterium]